MLKTTCPHPQAKWGTRREQLYHKMQTWTSSSLCVRARQWPSPVPISMIISPSSASTIQGVYCRGSVVPLPTPLPLPNEYTYTQGGGERSESTTYQHNSFPHLLLPLSPSPLPPSLLLPLSFSLSPSSVISLSLSPSPSPSPSPLPPSLLLPLPSKMWSETRKDLRMSQFFLPCLVP